ncbi:hypothetical protein NVV94_10535 [Pseudomonas sp. LS1212]|uniref:hypothetical protein n=1 Tax=Pseudomonas sp. LS1212 TaxID=2972478 RepID=UPI00215CEE6E|nr:hypothetical protein [Pseudomonas sp. LS1212]UVJ45935.1 hypothetical protein NVV94_10535 [Pseudomonas sp. LS1212]
MRDISFDENPAERRNRRLGEALGLNPDEVSLWIKEIDDDGSGMGYVVQFKETTPTEIRAKVQGLGSDLSINIGPID